MAVTKFRITANQLEPRVHKAAEVSANVVFIPPLVRESLAGSMLFRQALSCLREGKIRGKPKKIDDQTWEFDIERYAAKRWVSLHVVAKVAGDKVIKLIVIREDEAR